MTYVLEIGSTVGSIEAESITEAYEKLAKLLPEIGMELDEWGYWEGGRYVPTGGYYVKNGGHPPNVRIYVKKGE